MRSQLFDYVLNHSGAITLEDILLNFLVASVLSLIIYLSYRISHASVTYSARFNISLVMLTLVTTLVMNVIGNNIALSLGMVGALSIVRFRTAIKDPRDTAYIFWCIAVGICCGVSEYVIAGIGSAVIFLFMVFFGFARINERYLIVIRGKFKAVQESEKIVDEYFRGKARLRVKNNSTSDSEYIYEVSSRMMKPHKNDISFEEAIRKIDGINQVNIICQTDEISQ